MHHLLCWTASVTNGVINFDTAAVTDAYANVQNGHYLMPEPGRAYAALGVGATISRMRIVAPTMRSIILPNIQPLNVGANVVTPTPIASYGAHGFPIRAVDELECDITITAGAPERDFGLLWVGDGNMNVQPGDIWTARATASITGVTGSWVTGNFTFDQGLPAGVYQVVGLWCIGANLIAARIAFLTGGRRPGCPGQGTAGIVPHPMFRFGNMGVWGQFAHTAQPLLDIMVGGACTSQELGLDLIKIQ